MEGNFLACIHVGRCRETMFWNRRNEHATDEELSAMLDGELPAARQTAVAAHAGRCERCTEALEQLGQIRTLLQGLPQERAPRSFALTPEMAGGRPAPSPAAPKRSPLVFAPAVALTLLVALFAVDLSSSGFSSREEMSSAAGGATANQAEIARTESSAGDGAMAPDRTFSSPQGTPQPMTAPALMPPPATGSSTETTVTTEGDAGTAATTMADDTAGSGDSALSAEGRDGAGGGTGTDWLLIGQVVAAVAFVLSAVYVFVPGVRKRGI